ncbi:MULTISPECIES: hypothetical protein [unclassified Ekhidna]|jgi:hypothetical protein|uniref:hypothetical protein n=1 Tax=unclassified Ekhidna TaxID=2632188 RepID=UPI0032E03156
MNNKPRVLKAFEALDVEIQEQIKLAYPEGFEDHLIKFVNKEGKYQSGLPFETEDKYYLVKMTRDEAKELIEEDDDYDEDGNLRDEVKEDFEDKYEDDM